MNSFPFSAALTETNGFAVIFREVCFTAEKCGPSAAS
jgi:hypothetical protein